MSIEENAKAAGMRDTPSENAKQAPFWFETKLVDEESGVLALLMHANDPSKGSMALSSVSVHLMQAPDVERAWLAFTQAIGAEIIRQIYGNQAVSEVVFSVQRDENDDTPVQ